MQKRIQLVFLFSILSLGVMAQGIRFSIQGGMAIPMGEFSEKLTHPENGGFAKNGFDIKIIGERIYKSRFIVGVNLGYTLFGLDKDAIKEAINPSDPNAVHLEVQPFQNVNLQARGGYYYSFMEDKMSVVPFVDLGLGIFNSAYYSITMPDGSILLREGSSGLGFLVTTGLEYSVAVNEYVNVKLFGNYQFTDYSVDENLRVIDINNPQPRSISKTINYPYSSASVGLGVAFTL